MFMFKFDRTEVLDATTCACMTAVLTLSWHAHLVRAIVYLVSCCDPADGLLPTVVALTSSIFRMAHAQICPPRSAAVCLKGARYLPLPTGSPCQQRTPGTGLVKRRACSRQASKGCSQYMRAMCKSDVGQAAANQKCILAQLLPVQAVDIV